MNDFDKMISRSYEETILENKENPTTTIRGKTAQEFVPKFFPYAKITRRQYEVSFNRATDKRIEMLKNTLKANEREFKSNIVMRSIVVDIIGREMRELVRMRDAFAILSKERRI